METTTTPPQTVTEPVKPLEPQPQTKANGMSPLSYASVLGLGVYLGIIFTKSEVASWQRVHDMFLFREAHMYIVIGVGVAVAMVSMFVIKQFHMKDVAGKPIKYSPKPYHLGVVLGGMIFGAGWAITGACPGPIYAQLGAGEWMAGLTLLGALAGMFTFATLKSKLPF